MEELATGICGESGAGASTEELAERRQPASFELLEEEERDNMSKREGFLSFMEFGGLDLWGVD